jgi:hypothetical protein
LGLLSHCRQTLKLTTSIGITVYLEVHGIIRGTRQFMDDIGARYFQGFHPHLPIISRIRYNSLITLGAEPEADYSVLLLTMCLITYAPALGHQPGQGIAPPYEQQNLYLAARSLLAQIQCFSSPSVPLIQAGLLIAVYEYRQGRSGDAFATIASTARIAYAARINSPKSHQTDATKVYSHTEYTDLRLQAEEAANTWWAIVIYERYVFPKSSRNTKTIRRDTKLRG